MNCYLEQKYEKFSIQRILSKIIQHIQFFQDLCGEVKNQLFVQNKCVKYVRRSTAKFCFSATFSCFHQKTRRRAWQHIVVSTIPKGVVKQSRIHLSISFFFRSSSCCSISCCFYDLFMIFIKGNIGPNACFHFSRDRLGK